jgi:hypothetical protein
MAKTPKNHRSDWTAGDLKQLRQFAKANMPSRVAALKLRRTAGAVQQKASVEGISFRSTKRRAHGTKKR